MRLLCRRNDLIHCSLISRTLDRNKVTLEFITIAHRLNIIPISISPRRWTRRYSNRYISENRNGGRMKLQKLNDSFRKRRGSVSCIYRVKGYSLSTRLVHVRDVYLTPHRHQHQTPPHVGFPGRKAIQPPWIQFCRWIEFRALRVCVQV